MKCVLKIDPFGRDSENGDVHWGVHLYAHFAAHSDVRVENHRVVCDFQLVIWSGFLIFVIHGESKDIWKRKIKN